LDLGRPLAAPLEQCAQLLAVDLVTVRELAAKVEPYLRADGTRIWSLTQLERQLRPELYAGAEAATSTVDRLLTPMPRLSGALASPTVKRTPSGPQPELFADTTIFHKPGRSPTSGDYQGLDQVLGFFGALAERSGGTFRATLHDVVANEEHAVGLHSSDAERDGRAIRSPTVLVSISGMAGSPRPGRTTTTSTNSTSSGCSRLDHGRRFRSAHDLD
jgi:hypothetical protein